MRAEIEAADDYRLDSDLFSHKASLVPDADYAFDSKTIQLMNIISACCNAHCTHLLKPSEEKWKDRRQVWLELQWQRGCPDDQGDGCISCN